AEHLARMSGARSTDHIETYHDRVREAALSRLDQRHRRKCHYLLALAFEVLGSADAETLFVHWRGAGDAEKASVYAERAAALASGALAFDRAARLYRLALELSAERGAPTDALRVRLGDALVYAGRSLEAADVYLFASNEATGARALELRRRAADQLLRSGHVDEGIALFDEILAVNGWRLAPTPRRALRSLLIGRARIRLRGLRFRQRDASQIASEQLARIDTCWSVATGLGMVDNVRGVDFQ